MLSVAASQRVRIKSMRFLFVKPSLAWPRSSGHDVHCYHLMKALAARGHELALATVTAPQADAVAGLPLATSHTLGDHDREECESPLTGLPERFRSYWGIPTGRIAAVSRVAEQFRADSVVVVGLDVLPYLGGVRGRSRVWYAGDEWIWHHLSQMRLGDNSIWKNLREAAVKGLYERSFAPIMDRVWVVSDSDGRAMRRVVGARKVVVVPNGVDSDYFQPRTVAEVDHSCVFWGRLDFGPNIQAIQWFCNRVWPALRRRAPDATFTIYGFKPTEPVCALAGRDGVSLVPDLPDLRAEIARHAVVVLPFVSGGGIKNKLLEAASLAKAVVGSSTALNGLRRTQQVPMVCVKKGSAWVDAILELWADGGRRDRLGQEAREWVIQNHSWEMAAQQALAGLES
jgi:glycosyltransferase involved in cell wall biosynthesis